MNQKRFRGVAGALIFLFCGTAGFAAETVELVSQIAPSQVSGTGAGARPFGGGDFFAPRPGSLSADGRYLLFLSPETNLAAGQRDGNQAPDLFLRGFCGVPAAAAQAVVKITVSQGTGNGNVQIFQGQVTSPSSGILRFNRGVTRSAGFTVPLGKRGIDLLPFVAGNGTVRVAVEVDGYVP